MISNLKRQDIPKRAGLKSLLPKQKGYGYVTLLLLATLLSAFGNPLTPDSNDTNQTETPFKISRKMQAFEKEKRQNEAEAQRLEEEGWCPCSIQQP